MSKPKASENKAKDVEKKPLKEKRIDISDQAKAKIVGMNNKMNTYLGAIVDEKGIKGPWTFDFKKLQIVVPG